MNLAVRRFILFIAITALFSSLALAQSDVPAGPIHPRGPIKQDKQSSKKSDTTADDQQSPPDSAGQASSKESRGDTTAPLGDLQEHPESESAETGELHLWNPHKADKDVEVGDYHMRRHNYPAAESRYREALQYQNNNAPAMFGLAEALEK
jgi:cytoskeletal protein RodZ